MASIGIPRYIRNGPVLQQVVVFESTAARADYFLTGVFACSRAGIIHHVRPHLAAVGNPRNGLWQKDDRISSVSVIEVCSIIDSIPEQAFTHSLKLKIGWQIWT